MRVSLILVVAALLAPGTALAQKAGTTRDQFVKRVTMQFQKLDVDTDGKVTADELAASGKPRRAQHMMKQIDANGDGVLTADEMTASAGARFDKRDANHNGTIDADEAPINAGQ